MRGSVSVTFPVAGMSHDCLVRRVQMRIYLPIGWTGSRIYPAEMLRSTGRYMDRVTRSPMCLYVQLM